MINKRSRRPRKPNRAEQAQKLRNNAAMRRVYEAAVRQREGADPYEGMLTCQTYGCSCGDAA